MRFVASVSSLVREGRLLALARVLGLGAILAVILGGCYYVVPAPPPYAAPVPGPPPAGAAVYIPGQWVWNGVGWVWRPGYWAAAQPGGVPPPGVHPVPQPPPPAPAPAPAPKP